jgi:hypothetical protein
LLQRSRRFSALRVRKTHAPALTPLRASRRKA